MQNKHKIFLGVLSLGLIALAATNIFENQKTTVTDQKPPEINLSYQTLQGSLNLEQNIGCYLNGHQFTEQQKEDFKSTGAPRTPIEPGIHMYFSPTDLTVQQLLNSILPKGQVLIAHYSPTNNPQRQFAMYPSQGGPSDISNPSEYTLPANQGFFIISCEKTAAYNIKNHTEHASQLPADFPDNIGSEWMLMSVPSGFDHKKYNFAALWPQRNAKYVEFSENNQATITAFTKALNLSEMYNFAASSNKMAWVRLAGNQATSQTPPPSPELTEPQKQPADHEEADHALPINDYIDNDPIVSPIPQIPDHQKSPTQDIPNISTHDETPSNKTIPEKNSTSSNTSPLQIYTPEKIDPLQLQTQPTQVKAPAKQPSPEPEPQPEPEQQPIDYPTIDLPQETESQAIPTLQPQADLDLNVTPQPQNPLVPLQTPELELEPEEEQAPYQGDICAPENPNRATECI